MMILEAHCLLKNWWSVTKNMVVKGFLILDISIENEFVNLVFGRIM